MKEEPVVKEPIKIEVPAREFVFCMECGERLPGNAKFCFKCGTKVQ